MRAHLVESAFQSFAEIPALYIHPNRTRDWLPHIRPDLAPSLLQNTRLAGRMSALIAAYYGLSPVDSTDGDDIAIALLDVTALSRLIHLSGAIFYGQYMSTEISGTAIADLLLGLGAWAYEAAVDHADLGRQFEGDAAESIQLTRETMISDGYLCFCAWAQAIPAPVSQRVWLKFANGPPPDDPQPFFRALGPEIVRAAAKHLFLHVSP
jgi:hypothetical protein